ncbi:hypothetical protein ACWGTI_26320 [Mesorhizobium sp. ArgA1]
MARGEVGFRRLEAIILDIAASTEAARNGEKGAYLLHKSLHTNLKNAKYRCVNKMMREGYSVSKTAGRRFEPCCPCHFLKWRFTNELGAVPRIEKWQVACHIRETEA